MTSSHGRSSLSPPFPSRTNQAESQAVTSNAEAQAAPDDSAPQASSDGQTSSIPPASGPHTTPHTADPSDRTRPTGHDLIRATALSLRDLCETIGADDGAITLQGGTRLTWDCDDGFHLLPPGVEELDISEWVDRCDFLPVDGVGSVRQQPELRAKARRA
jgi:hypothetical protein